MSTEYQGKTAYPEFVGEASDGHYARDVSKELTELIEDLRTQSAAQGKRVARAGWPARAQARQPYHRPGRRP